MSRGGHGWTRTTARGRCWSQPDIRFLLCPRYARQVYCTVITPSPLGLTLFLFILVSMSMFKVRLKAKNPSDDRLSQAVEVLVDSGSELTWLPRHVLESIG